MTVRRIGSFVIALGVALMHNTAPPVAISQVIAQGKGSTDNQTLVTRPRWASRVPQLPTNVTAQDFLRPILCELLKKSPTFRRQCLEISRSHNLRIAIKIVAAIPQMQCMALSTVKRFADGQVMITIMIVAARSNYVELIGHEFEHALEQAEGLDLKALRATASDQVYQLEDGSYETRRAKLVGLEVAREFRAFREPNVKTSTAGNAQVQ